MVRLLLVLRKGRMFHLLLSYCLVYVTLYSHSTNAADIEIYPKFSDEAILKRIQHILTEWREKQLHIQLQEPESLPQFTFHFPEERNQNYQSDFFAVPPSDPRYYQQQPAGGENSLEKSREGEDGEADNILHVSIPANSVRNSAKIEQVTSKEEFWTDYISSEPPSSGTKEDSIFITRLFSNDSQNIILVAVIAGCGAAIVAGVIAISIGWYRLHNNSKAAADIEYPAYGVTGPNKEITPTGDRRLAQSAQMYHYQHQKQQIIAMENNRANNERRGSVSEGDSDEENEEGDYTVYECPGLAATGELEVKNPLFLDDPTPAIGNNTREESPNPAEKK